MYLTGTPAVLAIAATFPEGLNLPLGGASAIVLLAISHFLGQVSSDFGKRLEPGLWDAWGGPPTTRFLRHDNTEFNTATRSRIHDRLRLAGLRVPTAEEEQDDIESALDFYASAVDHIRQLTRDPERFPLVHKTNTEYGFRRNLLGLKMLGLATTSLAIAGTAWILFHAWRESQSVPPVALVVTLLNIGVALGWLVGVRAATVRITAERYAKALLEAILNLEPKT